MLFLLATITCFQARKHFLMTGQLVKEVWKQMTALVSWWCLFSTFTLSRHGGTSTHTHWLLSVSFHQIHLQGFDWLRPVVKDTCTPQGAMQWDPWVGQAAFTDCHLCTHNYVEATNFKGFSWLCWLYYLFQFSIDIHYIH